VIWNGQWMHFLPHFIKVMRMDNKIKTFLEMAIIPVKIALCFFQRR
jgi:hypothetical protein